MFSHQTILLVLFYFDQIFFSIWATVYNTGPTLKQQTYASMSLLYFDSVICRHRIADGGPTLSQQMMNVLRQLGFVTTTSV